MDQKLRKRIITIIIITAVCIVAFSVLIWLSQHGRLVLHTPEDARKIAIVDEKGNQVRDVLLEGGDYSTVLPTGQYEVSVLSENDEKVSVYFLTINAFLQATEKTVTLYNQAARQKIGIGSEACPVFSGDTLYSYNCGGSGSISKVPQLSVENTITPPQTLLPNILSLQSYRDGMLALHTVVYQDERIVEPFLSFIKDGKIVQEYELPTELGSSPDGPQDYQFRINETDPERFAITLDNNRIIYTFDKLGAEGTKVTTENPPGTPNIFTNAIRYSDNTLIFAAGILPPVQEGEEGQEGVLVGNSVLVRKYAIDGENARITFETTLEDITTNEVQLCSVEHLCIFNDNNMTLYALSDNSSKKLATLSSVFSNNITPIDTKSFLYFKNERVFLFDIEALEARQIYSSPHFRVSSLSHSSKGTILNAFPLDQDGSTRGQALYSFLLSTEPAEDNRFIDNVLPYPPGAVDGAVLRSDFFGNTVVIRVQLDSWQSPVRVSGGGARDFTFDQAEFNEKKQRILDQLARDGITPDKYNIHIKP